MAKHFWVIETPRSIVDRQLHRHIIYALNRPAQFVAGPFPNEGDAIDWLNDNYQP